MRSKLLSLTYVAFPFSIPASFKVNTHYTIHTRPWAPAVSYCPLFSPHVRLFQDTLPLPDCYLCLKFHSTLIYLANSPSPSALDRFHYFLNLGSLKLFTDFTIITVDLSPCCGSFVYLPLWSSWVVMSLSQSSNMKLGKHLVHICEIELNFVFVRLFWL